MGWGWSSAAIALAGRMSATRRQQLPGTAATAAVQTAERRKIARPYTNTGLDVFYVVGGALAARTRGRRMISGGAVAAWYYGAEVSFSSLTSSAIHCLVNRRLSLIAAAVDDVFSQFQIGRITTDSWGSGSRFDRHWDRESAA